MINTAYIHEQDFLVECMQEYNENAGDIQRIVGKVSVDLSRQRDMKLLGIYTEDADNYFTESVASSVSALGQKIIDLITKLKEMLKEFGNRIMGKKKVEEEVFKKIDKVRKENPKLADKLEIKLSQSDFKIDNVKDLNEYYKNVDQLIDRLKKEDIDPKSIRGKFEKIKEKLEKNSDAIKTATTIIGSAIAVGGFVLKIRGCKKACENVNESTREVLARAAVQESNCNEILKNLEQRDSTNETSATTSLKLFAEIQNHRNMVTGRNLNGLERLSNKILNGAADLVERSANWIDSKNKKNPNAREDRLHKNISKAIDAAKEEVATASTIKKEAERRMNVSEAITSAGENNNHSTEHRVVIVTPHANQRTPGKKFKNSKFKNFKKNKNNHKDNTKGNSKDNTKDNNEKDAKYQEYLKTLKKELINGRLYMVKPDGNIDVKASQELLYDESVKDNFNFDDSSFMEDTNPTFKK